VPAFKFAILKRYFITGLLIWVPLVITVWVLSMIIGALEQFLPVAIRPGPIQFLGFQISGLGAVMTLLLVFLTGLLATNLIGQKFVRMWELLLARIPVVSSLYNGVKQISDTILSPTGNAFRQALLVQYPRAGSWTIAFLTGKPGGDVVNHLPGEYVSVYVPTTPNPTSGFFLMMKAEEVVALDMSVDEALKYIISMGVVPPDKNVEPRARLSSSLSPLSSGTP
jgi:uncharacterized membrane protein